MSDAPGGGGAEARTRSRRRRRTDEGDALLVARTRLRLTQPEFAVRLSEALGRRVDRTQVAKWEAGVYKPRAAVMLAAARLVSMPLHLLLAEGAEVRGPAGAEGSLAEPGDEAGDPRRQQVLALLELGFKLPEAIDLVRRHSR